MMLDMSICLQVNFFQRQGEKGERTSTHPGNVLRARLRREHAQNTGATANVQDGLALKEVGVVDDGGAVRAGADAVFQHLLVDA